MKFYKYFKFFAILFSIAACNSSEKLGHPVQLQLSWPSSGGSNSFQIPLNVSAIRIKMIDTATGSVSQKKIVTSTADYILFDNLNPQKNIQITVSAYDYNLITYTGSTGGIEVKDNETSIIPITMSATTESGLSLYLRFDGNTNDTSGNGNDATNSGATLISDRFGNSNKAYSFNSGPFMTVTNTTNFNFTNSLTLMTWYQPISSSFQTNQLLFSKITFIGATNNVYQFLISTFGEISLQLNTTGPCGNAGGPTTFLSTQTISKSINTASHIAATWDGSTVSFYINGTLSNAVSVSGTLISCTSPLEIGRHHSGNPDRVIGILDQMRVYSRALSASEISDIYEIESFN